LKWFVSTRSSAHPVPPSLHDRPVEPRPRRRRVSHRPHVRRPPGMMRYGASRSACRFAGDDLAPFSTPEVHLAPPIASSPGVTSRQRRRATPHPGRCSAGRWVQRFSGRTARVLGARTQHVRGNDLLPPHACPTSGHRRCSGGSSAPLDRARLRLVPAEERRGHAHARTIPARPTLTMHQSCPALAAAGSPRRPSIAELGELALDEDGLLPLHSSPSCTKEPRRWRRRLAPDSREAGPRGSELRRFTTLQPSTRLPPGRSRPPRTPSRRGCMSSARRPARDPVYGVSVCRCAGREGLDTNPASGSRTTRSPSYPGAIRPFRPPNRGELRGRLAHHRATSRCRKPPARTGPDEGTRAGAKIPPQARESRPPEQLEIRRHASGPKRSGDDPFRQRRHIPSRSARPRSAAHT